MIASSHRSRGVRTRMLGLCRACASCCALERTSWSSCDLPERQIQCRHPARPVSLGGLSNVWDSTIQNRGEAQSPAKEIVDEIAPGLAAPEHQWVRPAMPCSSPDPGSVQTTVEDDGQELPSTLARPLTGILHAGNDRALERKGRKHWKRSAGESWVPGASRRPSPRPWRRCRTLS